MSGAATAYGQKRSAAAWNVPTTRVPLRTPQHGAQRGRQERLVHVDDVRGVEPEVEPDEHAGVDPERRDRAVGRDVHRRAERHGADAVEAGLLPAQLRAEQRDLVSERDERARQLPGVLLHAPGPGHGVRTDDRDVHGSSLHGHEEDPMRRPSTRRLVRLARTALVACLVVASAAYVASRRDEPQVSDASRLVSPSPSASPTPTPPPPSAIPTAMPAATASATASSPPTSGRLMVVAGSSAVSGPGPVKRFVVEIEEGAGIDGAAFAAAVESVLFDSRSWGGTGRFAFQRVETGGSFKVALATPETTRRLCRPFDTGRSLSCYSPGRAVLNLYSWTNGRPFFPDLATYRSYVVNHEVGHALGHRHVDCPGAGQPAPVMMQQSKGLNGCTANGWPLPTERG